MARHPRLYRRGATYYHRAAVPVDIQDTYPKTEETFSLRTSDFQEAKRRVRVAAVEVDQKFEAHRQSILKANGPMLGELNNEQLNLIEKVYYAHLLDEDDETRATGFYDPDDVLPEAPVLSFEENAESTGSQDELIRHNHARGKVLPFFMNEALEVLTWEGVELRVKPSSPSITIAAKVLQKATIRANQAIAKRNEGDIVETP
ncbi:DUF6538 domain-containing protein [Pseudovibrio sp. Tun.PSC04-5.I4]|uniref:DUF6538 domain-containing protein n=1 Tax=Pseudovibrio sp. Tun.PSC04-5.I4 TaxID=1798213 RepID=UPI0008865C7A|nr:DUF6538 domain-containing protein [Pseudovibrio sp. Tun.PSC04-5.I4]SDR19615.1 hypothetical protein SAMN04515695_3330 [Pseudovibrio sp. Tun.PSC04-5.I4]